MSFSSDSPNTKLSGLKICPKGPDRTESMVPGSRSTRIARGTYLPPPLQGEQEKEERGRTEDQHTHVYIYIIKINMVVLYIKSTYLYLCYDIQYSVCLCATHTIFCYSVCYLP